MAHTRASIDSPEVIKDFRYQLIKFDSLGRQAVAGAQGDAHRVAQWLSDQAQFWKKEAREREEDYQRARVAYNQARDKFGVYGKESSVDERKELKKAEVRREEAEHKMKAIKKWITVLGRETEELMGPVRVFSSTLDSATPRALSKLDGLLEKLEEYMRMAPPT